ncbi:unnamed protein product, partial [marine sediment metagenome]
MKNGFDLKTPYLIDIHKRILKIQNREHRTNLSEEEIKKIENSQDDWDCDGRYYTIIRN